MLKLTNKRGYVLEIVLNGAKVASTNCTLVMSVSKSTAIAASILYPDPRVMLKRHYKNEIDINIQFGTCTNEDKVQCLLVLVRLPPPVMCHIYLLHFCGKGIFA